MYWVGKLGCKLGVLRRGKCIGLVSWGCKLGVLRRGKCIMSADNSETNGLDKNARSASNAGLQAWRPAEVKGES